MQNWLPANCCDRTVIAQMRFKESFTSADAKQKSHAFWGPMPFSALSPISVWKHYWNMLKRKWSTRWARSKSFKADQKKIAKFRTCSYIKKRSIILIEHQFYKRNKGRSTDKFNECKNYFHLHSDWDLNVVSLHPPVLDCIRIYNSRERNLNSFRSWKTHFRPQIPFRESTEKRSTDRWSFNEINIVRNTIWSPNALNT